MATQNTTQTLLDLQKRASHQRAFSIILLIVSLILLIIILLLNWKIDQYKGNGITSSKNLPDSVVTTPKIAEGAVTFALLSPELKQFITKTEQITQQITNNSTSNVPGPAGATGVAGPVGPAGATGPQGPSGSAGTCPSNGTFLCQNGNAFGAIVAMGSTDAQDVNVITNGISQTLFDQRENLSLQSYHLTAGSPPPSDLSGVSTSIINDWGGNTFVDTGISPFGLSGYNIFGGVSTTITDSDFIVGTAINSSITNSFILNGAFYSATVSGSGNIGGSYTSSFVTDTNGVNAIVTDSTITRGSGVSGSISGIVASSTLTDVFDSNAMISSSTVTNSQALMGMISGSSVTNSSLLNGVVNNCTVDNLDGLTGAVSLAIVFPTTCSVTDSSGLNGLFFNDTISNSGNLMGFYGNSTIDNSNYLLGTDQGGSTITDSNRLLLNTNTSTIDNDISSIISGTGSFSNVSNAIIIANGMTIDGNIDTGANNAISAGMATVDLRLGFNGQDSWTNIAGGNFGIGNNTPANKLDVTDIADDTPASFTGTSGTCTVDTNAGALSCVSDQKLKTNILAIGNGLDIINQLQGVTYNWKVNPDGSQVAGFIAQDVQKVLPNLVTTLPDGTLTLNKEGIMPYIVEAVKQQSGNLDNVNKQLADNGLQLENLTKDMQSLVNRVDVLETDVTDLKSRVKKLEQNSPNTTTSNSTSTP